MAAVFHTPRHSTQEVLWPFPISIYSLLSVTVKDTTSFYLNSCWGQYSWQNTCNSNHQTWHTLEKIRSKGRQWHKGSGMTRISTWILEDKIKPHVGADGTSTFCHSYRFLDIYSKRRSMFKVIYLVWSGAYACSIGISVLKWFYTSPNLLHQSTSNENVMLKT